MASKTPRIPSLHGALEETIAQKENVISAEYSLMYIKMPTISRVQIFAS
jgi:hypothetical protein